MERFYPGDRLGYALRVAERLHRLTGKTVYVNEDFGSDREDDPWGFFVSTEPPMHLGCLYHKFGGDSRG